MPFSDDFSVHRFRGTKVTGLQGIPDGPGVLTFTKSADHDSIICYEVRVYPMGTSSMIAELNIGKPIPYSDGTILVDLNRILSTLSDGNYTVTVVATSATGSAESVGDDFVLPLT